MHISAETFTVLKPNRISDHEQTALRPPWMRGLDVLSVRTRRPVDGTAWTHLSSVRSFGPMGWIVYKYKSQCFIALKFHI
jgi:hypothetical protein